MITKNKSHAKEVLEKCKCGQFKTKRLQKKLESLNDSLGVKAVSFSDMPKGGYSFSQESVILEKMEVEKRLQQHLEEHNKLKERVVNAIDRLTNNKHALALELYYIDCMPVMDMMYELDRDRRTIERWINRGIETIDLKDVV